MAPATKPPPSSSSSSSSTPRHKPIAAAASSQALPHRAQKTASSASGTTGTTRAPLPSKPTPVAAAPPPPSSSKPPTQASPSQSKPSSSSSNSASRASAPVGKMAMAAVISPNPVPEQPQPKISMTSKEWVIPPRPKPGRKPATDTPPTKRKAQNRAAQRAFRERRAARVGELEELLDQQKDDHDKVEAGLKEKIHDLELDLQSFRSRCMLLENMLEKERQERIRTETEAETLRRRHGDGRFRTGDMTGQHQHYHHDQRESSLHQQHQQHQHRHSIPNVRQPPPQHVADKHLSINQILTPSDTVSSTPPTETPSGPITCGNCSLSGRCACAEEVLASAASGCGKCGFGTSCQCLEDVAEAASQGLVLKRAASPVMPNTGLKRHRPSVVTSTEIETDFTGTFSRKPTNVSHKAPFQPVPLSADMPSGDAMGFKDSCGFCKDGTYCVCADTSMATPAMTPPPSETDVAQPPIPMEMTAEGAVKLPKRKKPGNKFSQPANAPSKSSGCGPNGPGSCAQCQADPKSGLFCRLMAATYGREASSSGAGGCCGGKGASGGCCKSNGPEQEKITLPSLPSLGLSCAEAYQTLSSHRNFEQAADEISTWLPKLKTTQQVHPRAAAPMPIEVEAASIMSVLKEFDVRFGREC